MACVDTELCDKVDFLTSAVGSLATASHSDSSDLLSAVTDLQFETGNLSMWVQALTFLLIFYFLYRAFVKTFGI